MKRGGCPLSPLHHPFHLHEAGALHQHRHVRPQGALDFRQQFLDALEVHGARAEALCRMRRHLAQAEQALDAGGAGLLAHLPMQGGGVRPQFAHVAQDQDAGAGPLGQHLDGGQGGIRVGVVGVVDEGGAQDAGVDLQAALGTDIGGQALGHRVRRSAQGQGRGRGGGGVAQVVPAGNAQGGFDGPAGQVALNPPSPIRTSASAAKPKLITRWLPAISRHRPAWGSSALTMAMPSSFRPA
jgi:hypothetical protein